MSATAANSSTLDARGLPLVKPPYGRISAIDLDKGEIVWQIAHGETPDNVRDNPALQGLTIPPNRPARKRRNACDKDSRHCRRERIFHDAIRATRRNASCLQQSNGKRGWPVFMPAPQSGSPMTYMLNGQQYIVIAISGGTYTGELLAFRLPRG